MADIRNCDSIIYQPNMVNNVIFTDGDLSNDRGYWSC